jgi:hypothetical protein
LGLWLTFAAAIFGGIVTLVVAIINHQSSETKVEPKPPPATTTPVPAATVRPTPIPTATPTAEPTLSQLTLTPVFPTAEVKINGVAYSIVGMQVDNQRKENPTLRLTIRMTNNNVGGGVLFTEANCRLLLGDVKRAPISAPIGRVAINSSEDGEFIFPLPKGTRSAALEFWYRENPKQSISISRIE